MYNDRKLQYYKSDLDIQSRCFFEKFLRAAYMDIHQYYINQLIWMYTNIILISNCHWSINFKLSVLAYLV